MSCIQSIHVNTTAQLLLWLLITSIEFTPVCGLGYSMPLNNTLYSRVCALQCKFKALPVPAQWYSYKMYAQGIGAFSCGHDWPDRNWAGITLRWWEFAVPTKSQSCHLLCIHKIWRRLDKKCHSVVFERNFKPGICLSLRRGRQSLNGHRANLLTFKTGCLARPVLSSFIIVAMTATSSHDLNNIWLSWVQLRPEDGCDQAIVVKTLHMQEMHTGYGMRFKAVKTVPQLDLCLKCTWTGKNLWQGKVAIYSNRPKQWSYLECQMIPCT